MNSEDQAFVDEFLDHNAWYHASMNLLDTASELWTATQRTVRELYGDTDVPEVLHADVAGPSLSGEWKPYAHEPAVLLMAGYALEAGVKAVLTVSFPPEQLLRMDTSPPAPMAWFRRHDLNALFDRAEINRSPMERECLEKLQAFVEWAGRYPARLRGTRDLTLTTLAHADVDVVLALCRSVWGTYRRRVSEKRKDRR